ncbi:MULTISPECIES: GIY-YIG nuclease family protein [unclassified Mesorhizobium]|uniref:GIY-YIG nuclease family protein n=1 Tax=unclassified Mesorhizobium TaxID=325217 RepID=UPI00333C8A38
METSKQVWLRAFWGFDPENEGYFGFTHEGDRKQFLNAANGGDWVLIYGGVNEHTAAEETRQALGFLELSTELCLDVERMSPKAVQRRQDGEFEDRWNYGLVVTRAWRLLHNVHIRNIAVEAYSNDFRFDRASRGVLLNTQETERALSYPIVEVNVYGQTPIETVDAFPTQAVKIFKPSVGIPPSFGSKTHTSEDGENILYLMEFTGSATYLLGDSPLYSGNTLFKVGRSNDLKRRTCELNSGFPPPSVVKWKVVANHKFQDGESAHESEAVLKNSFDKKFCSVGGEFFVGKGVAVQSAFLQHCSAYSIVIKGAPGKNKL